MRHSLVVYVLVMALAIWGWSGTGGKRLASQRPTVTRELVVQLTVTNATARFLPDQWVTVRAPADLEGRQRLADVKSGAQHTVTTDASGNAWVRFPLELAPYASRTLRVRYSVRLNGAPHSQPKRVDREPSVRFPSDQPAFRRVVEESALASADAEQNGRAVFNWVAGHMQAEGYIAPDLGARYALEHGRGDCTEYMSLTTTLARSAGIPARGMAGFIVDGDAVLDPAAYHNWSEAWFTGAWHILDVQNEAWQPDPRRYVVFRHLDGSASDPSQGLFRHSPALEVSMR